jgi:biopolymer transport protein ExbD
MKNRITFHFLCSLLAAGLPLLAAATLHADEGASIASVKLSAPGKPSTLRIDMPWADIHINGVEGDTVTVESSLKQKGGKEIRTDGLRRLDDDVSFNLNEHENVVSLSLAGDNPWAVHDGDFKISVPRAATLQVKTEVGGDIDIKNITGDIEVNAMNGGVRLSGITGAAVINTMNGEVRATYAATPQKLISITSMNGAIDLRVPAETKANVRLRNQNGSILTDFDETALKTQSQETSASTRLVITALHNGEFMLGNRTVLRSSEELTAALAKLSPAEKEPGATIRSAEDIDLKYVTAAMDACRNVGINKIHLTAASSEKEARILSDAAQSTRRSADPVAPIPPVPPIPPRPPITGGKLVSGTLNGGGVDIKISTMNGEITLRRTNSALATASVPKANSPARVTVVFQDPDNFTDIRESHSSINNLGALDELRDYLQKIATPRLAAGTTLTITFLDVDFAGEIRPDQDNVRVVTDTTPPRVQLKFQLLGTDGEVLKEGERRLSDMNQSSLSPFSRNDPLSHEKQLLKDWIMREFKPNS